MPVKTISLIGMPGAGKSSVGVILAKRCGLRFVDTDLDLQVRAGTTLQEVLERDGYQKLRQLEHEVLMAIDLDRAVIATGGSVVYSDDAMQRLRAAGPVAYLRADLATLQQRVVNAPPRGIACDPGQGYPAVFAERTPLYQRYADFSVDAGEGSAESVAGKLQRLLEAARWSSPAERS